MATHALSTAPYKKTWNETSESGPYAVSDLMIWRGTDNNQINLSAMPDDTGKWKLGQTTEASVGAAWFRGLLWIAWTGTDNHLNVTTTSEPKAKVILNETSYKGLALAEFQGMLYLVWVGTDNHLNVIRSNDGHMWQDKVTLRETSSNRPALAAFNNQLYLAWTGMGEGHLNIMTCEDSCNKHTLPDTALAGPGLAVFQNRLYMAWSDKESRLDLNQSADGVNWSPVIRFEELSSKSVALVANLANLLYCWTGTDSRLNWMIAQ